MNRQASVVAESRAASPGGGVQLRRARVTDAEGFARMMSEPEVFAQLLQMPYADAELWRQRLGAAGAADKPDLLLVAEADGDVVGCAGLHSTGPWQRRRHAMALGIQLRTDWQGRGVGRLLMQSLCDYADRWLGLLRIELTVYTDNLRAQSLYRRFGFVEEGLHRAYALRDGVYIDAFCMARLNAGPQRLAGASSTTSAPAPPSAGLA